MQRFGDAEIQRYKEKMRRKNDFHNLIIWQKGKEFVKFIYRTTEGFPKSEIFGLQSQIRRAVVSFLLNIVEGHRRNSSQKEFLRFLDMADSSLAEVEACLELSLELGFVSKNNFDEAEKMRKELAVMLMSLMKKVESNL